MIEWMENVEKAISRIMADKVYTSAEFKRERDNFHVSMRYPFNYSTNYYNSIDIKNIIFAVNDNLIALLLLLLNTPQFA
jgi:hypothetical protein